jgi:hypothetical protein
MNRGIWTALLWLAIVLGVLPQIVPADPTGVARLRYTEASR